MSIVEMCELDNYFQKKLNLTTSSISQKTKPNEK